MDKRDLIGLADGARNNAYAPYSGFAVGAALLCEDGTVFLGSNVENASYPVTCCAERAALVAAVSAGKRSFCAIAVVGGKEGEKPHRFCTPCGICRQALSEFCRADFPVFLSDGREILHRTLGELLPAGFSADAMSGEEETV